MKKRFLKKHFSSLKRTALITAICMMGTVIVPAVSASAEEDVLLNQDFSGELTYTSCDYAGLPAVADADTIYYYKSNTNSEISVVNDVEGVNDEQRPYALKFDLDPSARTSMSAAMPLVDTVSGGVVRFDADFMTVNTQQTNYDFENMQVCVIDAGVGNDGRKKLLRPNRRGDNENTAVPVYGVRDAAGGDLVIGLSYNHNEWTHMSYVFDMDNHTYTAEVTKADGSVTKTAVLTDYNGISQIRGVCFLANSKAPIYLANIKMSTMERELPVGEKVLTEDTFDSYAETDSITASGDGPFIANGANVTSSMIAGKWYTHNISLSKIVASDNGDKVLRFYDEANKNPQYAVLAFDEQKDPGIICYEYDVRNISGNLYIGIGDLDKGRANISYLNGDSNIIHTYAMGYLNNHVDTGHKWSQNDWYHIKIEFDHDAGNKYNYQLSDADGNVLFTATDLTCTQTLKKPRAIFFQGINADISGARVRSLEASEMKVAQEMAQYGEEPNGDGVSIESDGVSFMRDGGADNPYELVSNQVPIDCTKIKLEFSKEILNNLITNKTIALYDKTANKVSTAAVKDANDKNAVILTLNEPLDPDSVYELYISDKICGYDGVPLGEVNRIKFTTGSPDKPGISGNPYISGIAAVGMTLQANYDFVSPINANEGDSEVYWYFADSADGKYNYTGVNSKYFKVTEEYNGKYLKYRVIPKDTGRNRGAVYLSDVSAKVQNAQSGVAVSEISGSGSSITVKLTNKDTNEKTASIIKVFYNSNGSINRETTIREEMAISAGGTGVRQFALSDTSAVIILDENGNVIFSKSGFKPDTAEISYTPYRKDINLQTGEVTITGKNEQAAQNRMMVLEVSTKASSNAEADVIYYYAAAQVNQDGEYIFKFNMPDGAETDNYTIKKLTYGSTETDSLPWMKPGEVQEKFQSINGALSDSIVHSVLKNNAATLLGTDTWWNVLTPASKEAIAKSIYNTKPYEAITDIQSILRKETALYAFADCTTAEQIQSLLETFPEVYAVNAENSVCYTLYSDFSDEAKMFAYSAMAQDTAEPTQKGAIDAFDRNVLVAAIGCADDPQEIREYLDNGSYRALISGFTNYSEYDPEVLAKHLYSWQNKSTMAHLKTAIAQCVKKSTGSNYTPQSGNASPGPGLISGLDSELKTPDSKAPVGNETVVYFNDLSGFEWATDAIAYLAERNIINGVADKVFEPKSNVTREQFAKMLMQAFELKEAQSKAEFADVNEEHWAYSAICTAFENGIVNGVDENNFGIGANITRQDMAVMVHRAIINKGLSFGDNTEHSFIDNTAIADYAQESVAMMAAAKVINGYDDGSFLPNNTATRAEAAQIIYNAIIYFN